MASAPRRASPGFGGRPGRSAAAAALLAAALSIPPLSITTAATLDEVRARGVLRCGIIEEKPGLAQRRDDGIWVGFDVDVCRAIAAAVLPRPLRIEIVSPGGPPEAALAAGDLDLVVRAGAAPIGLVQEAETRSTATLLVEGQGLMVALREGVATARELDGKSVCLASEIETEDRLREFAGRLQITVTTLPFANLTEAGEAFFAGDCAGLTALRTALAATRAAQSAPAEDYLILPDLLTRAPQGPRVRADDQQWLEFVRWTVFALIEAEERDITDTTAAALRQATRDPAVARFLGSADNIGGALDLTEEWVVRAIEASGNYGEIYDRHLGEKSSLKLERGPNALWLNGGLLQAMPFQ